MSDLERLLRQADRIPTPDLWSDIQAWQPRPHEPSVPRRLLVAAVALPVAAAGIVLAVTAFLGEREVPPPGPAADIAVDPQITAEITIGRFPQEIAVGEGAVWVTSSDADRWFLARIDPSTNEVSGKIQIDEVADVVAAGGSVWVAGTDPDLGPAAFRVDPSRGSIEATIPLDCGRCFPNQIDAGEGSVWVTVSTDYPDEGEVVRIDPETDALVDRTIVPGDPRDLVVGEGAVWVYSLTHFEPGCCVAGGTIYRLDPESAELVATLLEGRIPPAAGVDTPPVLAVGYGSLWTSVTHGDPVDLGSDRTEIVRVDPATNDVVGEPIRLGTLFLPFSSEGGGVWFRGGSEDGRPLISRLDPMTLQVEEYVSLDGTVLDGTIDPATWTMWLTTYDGSVMRVDLRPSTS
jgi:hypothetical protein